MSKTTGEVPLDRWEKETLASVWALILVATEPPVVGPYSKCDVKCPIDVLRLVAGKAEADGLDVVWARDMTTMVVS
ncbi:MAG: hypothetical protein COA38_20485 [Fluviicola sp.]|nr:MAG: hypothetical protein COA38_20485 [Fluviicola sp.]